MKPMSSRGVLRDLRTFAIASVGAIILTAAPAWPSSVSAQQADPTATSPETSAPAPAPDPTVIEAEALPEAPRNAVQVENDLPGSSGWFGRRISMNREIDGFTTDVSYEAGETFGLQVSTSAGARYRVEIYRLGWYGGAGARQVACLPTCTTDSAGKLHMGRLDAKTGLVTTPDWGLPDQAMIVPADWLSGYFMAVLVLTDGANKDMVSYVPFIVREPTGSPNSPVLVQAATTTWQAYNSWGGASLYTKAPIASAVRQSFDRPYRYATNTTPLTFELQLVRYLEREGHLVSYTTGIDVDRAPQSLLDHELVISNGHDEYWSLRQMNAFKAARDAGVNLAFMSSNAAYWHVRYENEGRIQVGHKDRSGEVVPPGALRTIRFRHLGMPECELLGVQYTAMTNGGEADFLDYRVEAAALADPWFVGTGIAAGDVFRNRVGYEWDRIVPGCATPGPVTALFSNTDTPGREAHAVRYTAPGGGTVFAAGSMAFSFALDDWRAGRPTVSPADERLQRFMANVVDSLAPNSRRYLADVDLDGVPDVRDTCPSEAAGRDDDRDGCTDATGVTPKVAAIVGDPVLAAGDRAAVDALLGQGWGVTVVDDDAIPADGDLESFTAVVVLSSVIPAKVRPSLWRLATGIVASEAFLLDDLRLGAFPAEVGAVTSLVLDPAHPITLRRADATVISAATAVNVAIPGPGAWVSGLTPSGRASLYSYDRGSLLVDRSRAPGRRVAFPWTGESAGSANAVGLDLFVRSVEWASQLSDGSGPGGPGPNSAPLIVRGPVSTSAIDGASVTLAAQVTGIPVPTLTWQRDGVDIPGASGSTLVLAAVGLADDGARFTVTATNVEGVVTSSPAVLSVVPRPSGDVVVVVEGQPTMTVATTAGSIETSWTLVDGSSAFQVRVRPVGGLWRWALPTPGRSDIRTGLPSGSYTVEVRALVGTVWGAWTSATVSVA